MCHWRRPEYTRLCIEYISRCHGIKDYTVLIHIDGDGNKDVAKECAKLLKSVKSLEVVKHGAHLGCNKNTKLALESGFAVSDYVIHIEDDVLVARDGLEYMEWASQFEGDPKIFTTGLWRHPAGWLPDQNRPWIPGHESLADYVGGFYVWGWGTWKTRWTEMRKGWTTGNDMHQSWDTILTQNVRKNRASFVPFISRSNNIGEALGTHRGANWIPHWADSPGFVEPHKFMKV